MKSIKYFIQFIIISIFFLIFKILGLKLSSIIASKIISHIGPFFRSKDLIQSNILKALPNLNQNEIKKISQKMWSNYGRILSEYVFIKKFRKSKKNFKIDVTGQEILEEIKNNNEPVIFVSGHFNNFELMAMQIENAGIELAAIYRPLNNFFLNNIMEKIRINDICKNQIKKGKSGTRELLEFFKKGTSIALMIDQRVSEGIRIDFFGEPAATTTIPAQLVKKYNCEIVPIYIERKNNFYFKMFVNKPISFETKDSIENISIFLNNLLEKMILKNPDQWIWTHDRWK